MSDRVTADRSDGVVTVTMDQPERDNPLRREEYRAIHDTFRAAREGDARCVVLQGAGDAFSSGFDVETMDPSHLEEPLPERVAAIRANEQALAREILTNPLPTVARVDGPAIGDAAGFALACDIALASERARIGFSHVRLGLGLDCGLSYTLPRRVSWGTTVELATTGRIVDGETAAEMGLVTRSVPDEVFAERADELVAAIAAGPPARSGASSRRSCTVPTPTSRRRSGTRRTGRRSRSIPRTTAGRWPRWGATSVPSSRGAESAASAVFRG